MHYISYAPITITKQYTVHTITELLVSV